MSDGLGFHHFQRFRRILLMGFVSTLLAACSRQAVVNTLLTPRWGHTRYTDIDYGQQPRQALDIYVPNKLAEGAPVVVFFYGGSWQEGSKSGYRFVGEALASRGFIAVLPDYRLYPQVRFPSFVDDAAKAVAWTHANIRDYGGKPCHLFVAGHSAGAHIAALLATNGHYLANVGLSISDLTGFIGMSGPYDFLPIEGPTIQKIFAPESNWPASQPINFVDGDEPPMLLLQGGADPTVKPANTTNLAARVNAIGGSAQVKIYPGVNHMMLLAPLATVLRFKGDELKQIANFVREKTAESSCTD